MGSYFAKKPKPKETPFELLERKIEGMNPNSYPTFEKSLDWSKTKHVYSDSICIKEKYVSYTLLSILFFFLFISLCLSLCVFFIYFSILRGTPPDPRWRMRWELGWADAMGTWLGGCDGNLAGRMRYVDSYASARDGGRRGHP